MRRFKKRRKKENKEEGNAEAHSLSSDSESIKSDELTDAERYAPFREADYVLHYPEDGGNFEYIVFLESTEADKPIRTRDMVTLANNIKKYNKGVQQLKRINRTKVGVIFDRPAFANTVLDNKNILMGTNSKLPFRLPLQRSLG